MTTPPASKRHFRQPGKRYIEQGQLLPGPFTASQFTAGYRLTAPRHPAFPQQDIHVINDQKDQDKLQTAC